MRRFGMLDQLLHGCKARAALRACLCAASSRCRCGRWAGSLASHLPAAWRNSWCARRGRTAALPLPVLLQLRMQAISGARRHCDGTPTCRLQAATCAAVGGVRCWLPRLRCRCRCGRTCRCRSCWRRAAPTAAQHPAQALRQAEPSGGGGCRTGRSAGTLVVARQPVLQAHGHPAVPTGVRVSGGQLLAAAAGGAARLAVHAVIVGGVALSSCVPTGREQDAAELLIGQQGRLHRQGAGGKPGRRSSAANPHSAVHQCPGHLAHVVLTSRQTQLRQPLYQPFEASNQLGRAAAQECRPTPDLPIKHKLHVLARRDYHGTSTQWAHHHLIASCGAAAYSVVQAVRLPTAATLEGQKVELLTAWTRAVRPNGHQVRWHAAGHGSTRFAVQLALQGCFKLRNKLQRPSERADVSGKQRQLSEGAGSTAVAVVAHCRRPPAEPTSTQTLTPRLLAYGTCPQPSKHSKAQTSRRTLRLLEKHGNRTTRPQIQPACSCCDRYESSIPAKGRELTLRLTLALQQGVGGRLWWLSGDRLVYAHAWMHESSK